MRLLHLIVIAALVLAAGYVYKIKFEATVQAERVAKIRAEIRSERDAVAALRAEWAKLDSPARIQGLAQRHLKLKVIDPYQFDSLDNLPERPREAVPADPIGAMLDHAGDDLATGSVAPPAIGR
jgi:cell division protein FtsL